MLDNLVYLICIMSVLFISLGILSLAEEKIPFLHKMTIRLINAMTFNENVRSRKIGMERMKNEETSKRHCKNK